MGKRKCSCLIAQPCTATARFRLRDVGLEPIPNQSQCRNLLGLSWHQAPGSCGAAGQVSQPPLSLTVRPVAAQEPRGQSPATAHSSGCASGGHTDCALVLKTRLREEGHLQNTPNRCRRTIPDSIQSQAGRDFEQPHVVEPPLCWGLD